MPKLFHISDNGEIERFEPRLPPSAGAGVSGLCVWAIDEQHLPHYLLPRDCPRVTFYPLPTSSPDDIRHFFGPGPAASTRHVIAIEAAWWQRASQDSIWIYELPAVPFTVTDAGAGYYIARTTVIPLSRRLVPRPLDALVLTGVELRIVPSLWPLHDAIIRSTLQFSCIRMRNAAPRSMESA